MPRVLAAVCLSLLVALPAAQARAQTAAQGQVPKVGSPTELPRLVAQPPSLAFGALASGQDAELVFTLRNKGGLPATLEELAFEVGASGTSETYVAELLGTSYAGAAGAVSYALDETLAAGATTQVTVTFAPLEPRLDEVVLRIGGDFPAVRVTLTGLGGHQGDAYLHVVVEGAHVAVDYDGDGEEPILLDGSPSHTHEPGFAIVDWSWSEGQQALGSGPLLQTDAALGPHVFTLTIEDDNVPPRSLEGSHALDVVPSSAVPGVLARYYQATPGGAGALLDLVPAQPDFGEVLDGLDLPLGGSVGSSGMSEDVLVRLVGDLAIATEDTYELAASGGVGRRLLLDGTPVTGPRVLAPGPHRVEARFALDATADLPVAVTVAQGAGAPAAPDPALLTHDESDLAPIVNWMPASGLAAGGNPVTLEGLGFFPAGSVVVHWGAADLDEDDFSALSSGAISFVTPPADPGPIAVTVETPQGTSKPRSFQYEIDGPVPILFVNTRTMTVPQPTAGAWGPDGKLYVAALDGRITIVGFDQSWMPTSLVTRPGVSGLSNNDTLGIAFDPYDPPSPVRLYVAHGQHFVNGGVPPTGPSPYTGQISMLEGPGFDTPVPVVTGLPVSNHDHALNAIEFDHDGDLLICVGSATNAGVADVGQGSLPESPLSAAILEARTSDPAFDGAVHYALTAGGAPDDDQRDGELVDQVGGDVSVRAAGTRNPFDLVLATSGHLYATDNGPNTSFGPASTGPTTQDPDPYDPDELLLVEKGNYYGHPNRSRGRTDPRQDVYRRSTVGASEPETFTQSLVSLLSSTDGLDEYRANTFQGQMRGNLVAQKWGSNVRRIQLAPDGRSVASVTTLDPWAGGLALLTGPGGALISLDNTNSKLRVLEPDDQSATGLVVHDIFPWRAPAAGDTAFVIGGVGFGTLGDTSVTIGGQPATLTSVSSKRIKGLIPASAAPTPDLLDVVVTVGASESTLSDGFRYLLGPGLELGRWEDRSAIPAQLGEVACGVIDGVLYVVGSNSTSTWAYDLVAGVWLSNPPLRPYPGDHHSAEVIDGKWYLFGGLRNGSPGRVQIYDPVAHAWSLGADMPWLAGSTNTALIDGLVYAAGGVDDDMFTTNECAVYDPVLDSWSSLSPMPDGRNHAAATTDGSRFWIFGGRKGTNFVQNGFPDVFVYDPLTDTWDWSGAMGTALVPMPVGRGGMGKAVWKDGEFYVFGGETLNGPGAVPGLNTFDRVDVYDPLTCTWRVDRNMPHPRHGVFPVLYQGLIYLPGGGPTAGSSWSSTFDVFNRQ